MDVTSQETGDGQIQDELTACRQRVAALEQQVETLNCVINTIPFPLFFKDTDGIYRGCNQAFATHIAGKDISAIVGKSLYELFPEQADFFHQADAELLRQGTSQAYEKDLVFTDGLVHTVLYHKSILRDPAGTPGGIVGTMQDMTEHKRIEQELESSRQYLQALFAAMDDLVLVLSRDGEYLDILPTNPALLYRPPAELRGKLMHEVMPTEVADGYLALIQRVLDSAQTHQMEYMLPVEAGEVWFHATVSPLTAHSVLWMARDVSERKRAEQERMQLQAEVIAAHQAALRELSTPLIPIANNIVIMTLIGTVDSARALQVLETLLEGVALHQADIAILDITGVTVVDTQVAQALIRAARAVKLLGATVILTGIQPHIAQTLMHLNADLNDIPTYGSLQRGIAAALEQGLRVRG